VTTPVWRNSCCVASAVGWRDPGPRSSPCAPARRGRRHGPDAALVGVVRVEQDQFVGARKATSIAASRFDSSVGPGTLPPDEEQRARLSEAGLTPTLPGLVDDLATGEPRGGYNGASTLAGTTGFLVGPALAGATWAGPVVAGFTSSPVCGGAALSSRAGSASPRHAWSRKGAGGRDPIAGDGRQGWSRRATG